MESDLSFITTQELIEEIMGRETFLGIVIKSLNEVTTTTDNQSVHPGGFEVRCKNMSPEMAVALLSGVSDRLSEELG